ncbi:hypothetical protein [Candidatus Pelagibacter sp. Uisw_127]|uniref:hypothetical protein n=1 Tax=Candidatus Pelagibacter sp. Uisw_127 TaxID=3230988 RepID=UPI0039EB0ED1
MTEKSITIVGSGINAYFFIKNLVNKDIKINLIDFSIDGLNKYNENSNRKFNNLSSPKILVENFDDNIDKFKELNCLTYNNFNTQSGLSIGGLSNVWGGTIYEFTNEELKKNNLHKFNLYDYLKYITDEDLKISEPERKPFFENLLNRDHFNINYNKRLLSTNGKPFNVKEKIQKLIDNKKINFIDGFVDKIIKKNDKYDLLIKDKNNNELFFSTKCLVLASGSISTARLLMDLLKKNNAKLLSTPLYREVFFTTNRHKDTSLNAIFSVSNKKFKEFSSHIFPLNGLNNNFFLQYLKIKNNFLNPIIDYLKPNLYGVYSYLSSDYSSIEIVRKNQNYSITANKVKNNKKIFKKSTLNNIKIFKIPFISKELLHGSDNHVGGSFPLKEYFNDLNELNNFKNLHVIDGTYLNYIPPLGYTLITILNAIRIAKNISR